MGSANRPGEDHTDTATEGNDVYGGIKDVDTVEPHMSALMHDIRQVIQSVDRSQQAGLAPACRAKEHADCIRRKAKVDISQ